MPGGADDVPGMHRRRHGPPQRGCFWRALSQLRPAPPIHAPIGARLMPLTADLTGRVLRRDLSGQQIGDLRVLRPGPNIPARTGNPPSGHVAWYCQCACGRVVLVTRDSLTQQQPPTSHCGCRYLKPAVELPPVAADAPPPLVAERVMTAQQALDRFHDAHSPLGSVRRVSWPVDDDEGRVLKDKDPWTD